MDQGTLGAISTVLVAVAFAGICWWAFSPRRKKRFDDAAKLPFADETEAEKSQTTDAEKSEPDTQQPQSTDDVARRN
ncbi:MAG TPA: cbb3-type cytochrome c oxidase subunit 3 [Cellvibrionaceae bacterium]